MPNVKFVLAGAGTEADENAIKKLIAEKDVKENVVFPGWVRGEQKDKLLKEADVFFLPSYNEGMPMSVLDAMGYGLPIVSTNVGGIPKIVRNEENGYCCEAGNIEKMAESICIILKEKKIREKYANESSFIVRDQYSLEFHLKLIETVYANALRGRDK